MENEIFKSIKDFTNTGGSLTVIIILAVFFYRYTNDKFSQLHDSIKEIKDGITWGDTCGAKHEEINRRLDKIERKMNGALKND